MGLSEKEHNKRESESARQQWRSVLSLFGEEGLG